MNLPRNVLILLAMAPMAANAAEEPAKPRPNIVVILSDDMGYSDIGCYGGEIPTPNLDKLAGGGLRFTRFYNTARCCPTRAALLTGLYSHQAGVGHMMEDAGFDGYRGNLSAKTPTIAEVLRPAGYRSYAVGKWHVTRDTGPDAPKRNWPLQRGFDRYYGTLVGAGNFFRPMGLTRDNLRIDAATDPEYRPEGYYYTDALSDHAAKFVGDHARDHKDKPFFLYVAYTAAHWPMHAPEADIARYQGKYDAGYGPIREARLARLRTLGMIDPAWKPAPTVGDWPNVADKAWEARCMEVYAAMVDRMDRGIGQIVESLKASGQLDNTLILYLQDNGGCAEDRGRDEPDQRAKMPGGPDSFVAYGRGWANVSNTPFREYKHWVHEGGISTPLIAHWPAGLAAERRGALAHEPGHLIDLMATCIDLAGAGRPAIPPEGVSLRPAFEGKPIQRGKPIFWEHEGNRAVLDGRWKLVAKHNQPWELYDVEADRTEAVDLAAGSPDRVKALASEWSAWATRVGVQPYDLVRPRPAGAATKKAAAKKKAAAQGKATPR